MSESQAYPPFSFTPEHRKQLIDGIDADALERLIQHVEPEGREMMLQSFTRRTSPVNQQFTVVGVTNNPTLSDLLDQVWAPTWIERGAEAIETWEDQLPGRELARQRLGLPLRGIRQRRW